MQFTKLTTYFNLLLCNVWEILHFVLPLQVFERVFATKTAHEKQLAHEFLLKQQFFISAASV